MKKIFYIIMVLGVVLTSCDPMDDVYNELDQLPSAKNTIVGDAVYTLTDDDYTLDISEGGFLELQYENFNSIDDAKTLIPVFLTGTYPVWGVTYRDDGSIDKASSAAITFKWYNKKATYSENVYELSSAEHNQVTGNTYGNFDRDYHPTDFLDAKYPNAEDGDFYSLKYKFYSGSVSTLTDGFYFSDGEWNKIAGFTPDQYKAMGESYSNFSSHDEAEAKTPIALLDVYKFEPKRAGDIVSTMYELFKGNGVTKSYTANYVFDGTAWSKYNNVANETIKFGHDGTTWVPDNTIKYTLTAADYDLVGNGRYGNFDVRAGKDDESEVVRLEKMNTILMNNFPNMAEGQKFSVSYNIYNGANGIWTMNVILENGEYVLQ